MTVEGQTAEIGTKEEGIGTKRQKEEHWTTFGEEEQELLAILTGGINMTERTTREERVVDGEDMATRVDLEEVEVVDLVVEVEVAMETMGDTEETMRDTFKTTEVMAETTEGMVEMTEGLVAMMEDMEAAIGVTQGVTEETVEDMEETVVDMKETVVAMEETVVAMEETVEDMEETLEDLAMVVDLEDKAHMGEAWVAPEVEEWVVQGEVAGVEREQEVRKRRLQWVQRG